MKLAALLFSSYQCRLFLKCTYWTFVLVLLTTAAGAQGIHFMDKPWRTIVKKALKTDKCIFLQLETADCTQCNAVADRAFKDHDLGAYFNRHFISVRLNGKNSEGGMLARLYSVKEFPVSLFLDAKGNLLNRYNGSVSLSSRYRAYAEVALSRRGKTLFSSLDSAYDAFDRNPDFLEKYILARREMNMPVDHLLDIYVFWLPKDSAHSTRIGNFILEQAPIIRSPAYNYVFGDRLLYRSVYIKAGREQRKIINNRIIVKSRNEAIKTKNRKLGIMVAEFAGNTWGNDTASARKAYLYNLLKYYKGTKDTLAYIPLAVKYYDTYFIPLSVDSLKEAYQAKLKERLSQAQADTIWTSQHTYTIRKKVISSPSDFAYSSQLNEGAWTFYEMVRDDSLLRKALNWSWHSLQYIDMPAYQDTYAHLLFRLGERAEAMKWEQKALDNAKARNMLLNDYEDALRKMKSGEL